MKRINPENYNKVKAGITLTIESYGFVQVEDKIQCEVVRSRVGIIISICSRPQEIMHEGKGTGKFDIVADHVRFVPVENIKPDGTKIHEVNIGLGLFKVYE